MYDVLCTKVYSLFCFHSFHANAGTFSFTFRFYRRHNKNLFEFHFLNPSLSNSMLHLVFQLPNSECFSFSFVCLGIYFRIVGYAKCNWTDILHRETTSDGNKGDRSAIQIHSGTEKYLNSVVYVIGAKNGKLKKN